MRKLLLILVLPALLLTDCTNRYRQLNTGGGRHTRSNFHRHP
ncbi:hypothetical protein [Hymenobacter cavernae]|nr:hypothetical protein [Hymenobacter cavernae]